MFDKRELGSKVISFSVDTDRIAEDGEEFCDNNSLDYQSQREREKEKQ